LKTAADLDIGEKGLISGIDTEHPASMRIIEYGFTPGQTIEVTNHTIFKDPIAFSIRGSIIALRKKDARCIKIN
jgi:ferrous iron transport protein A